MIDDLSSRPFDDGLAYFYCNHAEAQRRSADDIIRSLVKQLAVGLGKRKVHESIARLYESKKDSGFASAHVTFEEAETVFPELIKAFPRVSIVIDALDECFQEDRSRLIDFLNSMVETVPESHLKIFISSRRNDDIARQLRKEANVGVEAKDNGEDIVKFVKDKIENDSRRRERQGMQPITQELKNEIASIFKTKSHGM